MGFSHPQWFAIAGGFWTLAPARGTSVPWWLRSWESRMPQWFGGAKWCEMHSLAVFDAWIVWVVMTFSYRLILRSATSTHCIEIQTWIILNHWISDWQPYQDQTRIVYLVSCVLLLPCLLFCIVCTHIGHPNIVVGLSWSVIVAFHIATIIGCIPIMIGWWSGAVMIIVSCKKIRNKKQCVRLRWNQGQKTWSF